MIDSGYILNKLDKFLHKNDYHSAEKHILYWLEKAKAVHDKRTMLLLQNELCGLYRKLQRENDAITAVENALSLVADMGIETNIGAGTTYVNAGTVLKTFGKAEDAVLLFEKAFAIYKNQLSETDKRFGGLYNNMALAYVDINEF